MSQEARQRIIIRDGAGRDVHSVTRTVKNITDVDGLEWGTVSIKQNKYQVSRGKTVATNETWYGTEPLSDEWNEEIIENTSVFCQ